MPRFSHLTSRHAPEARVHGHRAVGYDHNVAGNAEGICKWADLGELRCLAEVEQFGEGVASGMLTSIGSDWTWKGRILFRSALITWRVWPVG